MRSELRAVATFFESAAAAGDPGLDDLVAEALASGRPVVPVVEDLVAYRQAVPEPLSPINGFAWEGPDPAQRLTLLLLEELGMEDKPDRAIGWLDPSRVPHGAHSGLNTCCASWGTG